MLSTLTSLHLPHPNDTQSQNHHHHLLHSFSSPFELKQLHAHLIKTSTPLTSLSLTRIAYSCSLTPSFSYAQQIFKHLHKPETTMWNSCLKDFSEGENPIEAFKLFHQLQCFHVVPDSFTLSFVLKACTRLLDLPNGKALHGFIQKLGFQSNTFLMNMVLNLYALCGEMRDARLVFDKMPQRDVVTWNIMMTQLVKRGDVEGAYDLFLGMPDRSVRSWTLMISGFSQCGKPKEAVRLFLEMEEAGVRANEVTVVAVLAACADLGDLDLGRRVHEYSKKCGFSRNVRLCNTLIEMYVKCGCLDDACKVFDGMKERTVVSWSAMISGLAMHGQAEEALGVFSNMIRMGVVPNDITFIGILHACSHIGFVDKGREFFARMTRDYGIVPRIEHYGCMVDILSRAGLLQEAHEFIMNMPIKPNAIVWGALLGGCKVHRNVELAEEAIMHLSELDPLNNGYYVVLSNIYAEAERWEDTVRVRKLMRDRGVKKTPGLSSITVDGVFHEFAAGDESHPQAEEIAQMWEKLLEKMKLKGYVPNTSVVLLDIEEDQKDKVLNRHSEKLALGFGLIKIKPGTPIRIMKNLRVCEDCHAALKLISEIANREIVVRDRIRFHCFKDGSCSCRDYW